MTWRLNTLVITCVGLLLVGCSESTTDVSSETTVAPASEPAPVHSYRDDFNELLGKLTTLVHIEGETPQEYTLEQRMAEHSVPAVSIAYMKDHKVVYTHTAGLRDVAGQLPPNPDTLFQAASISKPVAVMGLLSLAEEKGLDLDAPVNSMLTSWQVPKHQWQAENPVTLRHLASHTAGTTVHGFPGYARGEPVPTTVEVLNGAGPANTDAVLVDKRPGESMRYSGGGTTIIQLLMQDVAGIPFAELMQQRILDPADMTRSAYQQPISTERIQNAALPYKADGTAVEGGPHTYPELAAAGLWTTPTDLLHLAAQVQRAIKGETGLVVSPAMARQALSPQASLGEMGKLLQRQAIGLGFFLGGNDGKITGFGHGGANAGFRCQLYVHTDGDGIAIMTNSDNGGAVMNEILQAVSSHFDWSEYQPTIKKSVQLDAAALDRLAGSYQMEGLGDIVVTREGSHLVLNNPAFFHNTAFIPESDTSFFSTNNMTMTVEADDTGKITAIVLLGRRAERVD